MCECPAAVREAEIARDARIYREVERRQEAFDDYGYIGEDDH